MKNLISEVTSISGGVEECKLTTPSNQLLCYFCGQAGSRYDSFIDLRGHLLEKHNKQTRRLCFREQPLVYYFECIT